MIQSSASNVPYAGFYETMQITVRNTLEQRLLLQQGDKRWIIQCQEVLFKGVILTGNRECVPLSFHNLNQCQK